MSGSDQRTRYWNPERSAAAERIALRPYERTTKGRKSSAEKQNGTAGERITEMRIPEYTW